MRKDQGWKPLLNVHDHQAHRRYSLRNRHATMMDTATWAREYFGKSLLLNTVHRCIQKCNLKLNYEKRKAFINLCAEMLSSLRGLKSSEMDLKTKEMCSLVRQVHTSAWFWGKQTSGSTCQRRKLPDCYQQKVQKPASVMIWECIIAHDMGDLHICEGIIDVEAYVGIFDRHMLPSR